MQKLLILPLILILSGISSCENKQTKNDLVEVTENGKEVNKSETLSVEDILMLQNSGPWLSYKSMIANDVEKEYVFELGKDESAECYIICNKKNVKLTISKLSKKTKKTKQRILSQKVYFYKNDSTEYKIYNKKKSHYKATLALKHRIKEDSSINVQLDIYKIKK